MFFAKMNNVSWLGRTFLQVPNLEIFILIYYEELADTGCEICVVDRAGG